MGGAEVKAEKTVIEALAVITLTALTAAVRDGTAIAIVIITILVGAAVIETEIMIAIESATVITIVIIVPGIVIVIIVHVIVTGIRTGIESRLVAAAMIASANALAVHPLVTVVLPSDIGPQSESNRTGTRIAINRESTE